MKCGKKREKPSIAECDYDLYDITLPSVVMRRKRKISFLCSELEKMHPCYSGRCCSDTRYVIRSGKLIAEVAVMDKIRLAEYRNRFPNRVLFLASKPGRAVFVPRSQLTHVVPFAVLAFCVCGTAFAHHASLLKDKNSVLSKNDGQGKIQQVSASILATPEKTCSVVLAAIKKTDGSIRKLSVKKGICSFSVLNVKPEEIAGAENCAVSYEKGIPFFTLVVKGKNTVVNPLMTTGEGSKKQFPFTARIRHELLLCGAAVLFEQTEPGSSAVVFSCSKSKLTDALNSSAAVLKEYAWHEKELLIEENNGECSVHVSFVSGSTEKSLCQIVSQYAELFGERNNVCCSMNNNAALKNSLNTKIGEIIDKNGLHFAYYRTPAGKLVCRKSAKIKSAKETIYAQ